MFRKSFYFENDAILLKRALEKKGVWGTNIKSFHLDSIHKRLIPHASRPNFEDTLALCDFDDQVPSPVRDRVVGLIVETREHKLLPTTIVDVIERTGVKVQIFHGPSNKQFITESLKAYIERGQVVMTSIGFDQLTANRYNTLFLMEAFWERLIGRRKIFVFQTDAMLCKNSAYRLEDFLAFDYVGSAWNRKRPIGITLDGGNGGLSLRDWARSLEVIRQFPVRSWVGGEDGFFAFYMTLVGANVAKQEQCYAFSSQVVFKERSFGCHKISDMRQKDLGQFLEFSPEAEALL